MHLGHKNISDITNSYCQLLFDLNVSRFGAGWGEGSFISWVYSGMYSFKMFLPEWCNQNLSRRSDNFFGFKINQF